METLISVIVPIYNVESYLHKCIDSLLGQKYRNIEVILVNDGSTDSSAEICGLYQDTDKRVRVINKENGGVVSARKAGCRAARGEYILNVDGDDWVSPDCFEVLCGIMEEHHPDIICFGYYEALGSRYLKRDVGLPDGMYGRESVRSDIFPFLIEDEYCRYFPPALWSKAIRRDLYLRSQKEVDDDIVIGEDQACSKTALYYSSSVYIINKALYFYRYNPGSLTKVKKPFDWNVPELLGKHFENSIDGAGSLFKDQIERAVTHNLFNVVKSRFYGNEPYKLIKEDIIRHLEEPYYREAVKNCGYRALKGKAAVLALRFKWIRIIQLFSVVDDLRMRNSKLRRSSRTLQSRA